MVVLVLNFGERDIKENKFLKSFVSIAYLNFNEGYNGQLPSKFSG